MQDIGMQYHIHCVEGDVGRYVFLPGDPGRVEAIAAMLEVIPENKESDNW